MSALDTVVAILLVALCLHVGVLIVVLVRASLPQRRHPQRAVALTAGAAALVGELMALGGLLGRPAPPAWVAGALGLAIGLALACRSSWREHAAGRAAIQAFVAPPLVAAFVIALSLR